MRGCRGLSFAATAILLAGVPAAARGLAGADPLAVLPEAHCYNATQPNADYEAYGPTDVSVQAGDGRVTVGENPDGTLTVFKYPNPSFYNQVKYFAVSRDANGRAHAQFANEGSFAGIRYRTADGVGFSWLRDWRASQAYDSTDTPVPVTTYASPAAIGLTVSDVDLVPPGSSALVREYWVSRAHNSPVRGAQLVYFENFNPIATRLEYAPIADWCLTQLSDQRAAYDPQAHAILNWWQGTDSASGRPRSRLGDGGTGGSPR